MYVLSPWSARIYGHSTDARQSVSRQRGASADPILVNSAVTVAREAWAAAMPRSVINFTASILNSALNFHLTIFNLRFLDRDLILVSAKPGAAQPVIGSGSVGVRFEDWGRAR